MKNNRMQLDERDGQGSTVCPIYSLVSLFNDSTINYKNVCIIPDSTDESGCYVPEPGIEMVARSSFVLISILHQRIIQIEMVHGFCSKWKELKSKQCVYHADFMRSGNQDAENLTDDL